MKSAIQTLTDGLVFCKNYLLENPKCSPQNKRIKQQQIIEHENAIKILEAHTESLTVGNNEDETKYVLGEDSINGIKLDDSIRNEELYEFYITHRESFIDELIDWISEATKDKELMITDLKELMTWEDEYILSSNSTNSYIGKHSSKFNETCKELLTINKKNL